MMLIVVAKWRQFLQPLIDVLDQSRLIVVHINSGSDVHRRNQHHTFLDATLFQDRFNLRSDVDVVAVFAGVKLQIFGVEFHFCWFLFGILVKIHLYRKLDSAIP
jgi:hypothetical protein